MAGSVHDILDHIRATSRSSAERGRRFERLMLAFLRTDPQWRGQFSEVWMWADSPLADGNATDVGIDLVAREPGSDQYCAIQCKFYGLDKVIRKADLDSFFTASGKRGIHRRIVISSTDRWGPNAEAALEDQQVKVTRIGMSQLEASTIDWSKVAADHAWAAGEELGPRYLEPRKSLMPHQEEAIEAVLAGFGRHDRGRLTMACGTGKTLTSLKIAERLAAARDAPANVLVLVPSIALLSQAMREWVTESETAMSPFAVCSDPKVSKRADRDDSGDYAVHDLARPATTSAATLLEGVRGGHEAGLTVIFCTYQSLSTIAEAQAAGLEAFDLVICDEAHRTTGVMLADRDESNFTRIHDSAYISAQHRLYMTATPRIFTDSVKANAQRLSAELCSMDDESRFGPEFHRLGFGDAVEAGLLSDYRVMVLSVDASYAARTVQQQLADDNMELNVADAAKIIGVWNGLSKRLGPSMAESGFRPGEPPMRRAVAFAQNIAASKHLAEVFSQVTEQLGEGAGDRLHCEVQHVDGTMNALERNRALEWLKAEPGAGTARILSNARCLSEGVDVPALDAVLFLHPRNSVIDIIQAVGRVMRRAPGKEYGYIILPVAVPEGMPPNEALDDNERYRAVWQVLNALRSHDERFNALVNRLGLNKSGSDRIMARHIDDDHDPNDLNALVQAARAGAPSAEEWRNAIYARIVQKVGNRVYWKEWAKEIADIAGDHTTRIRVALDRPGKRAVFDAFVTALRSNLNPAISDDDAIEMLAQHLITKPVFDALFEQYAFAAHNPVSVAMDAVLEELDDQALDSERDKLKRFYEQIRVRIEGIDNPAGRQKVMLELYEQFFKAAMPRIADRLGIVYTPVEVVDFILHLTDRALRAYLNVSLSDAGVHVVDPFTGTGAFLSRLLQAGLVHPEDLLRKYGGELHANEIVLLAYYIATINIEQAFHGRYEPQRYQPFEGIVLTDTFQLYEHRPDPQDGVLEGNNRRAVRQHGTEILVVLGNPPYSVGQSSQNDGNRNLGYGILDRRIRETYAAKSAATNKNSLYDSYVRALRWASDRIKGDGVICFVLNNGFIDGNTAEGLRKTLVEEFDAIYCYNLRGNQRTAGEASKREGGKIFGSNSRAGIAVLLLVKGGSAAEGGPCRLFYQDIGDYHSRSRKLEILTHNTELLARRGLESLEWRQLEPNTDGDWINPRDKRFQAFRPLARKRTDLGATPIFTVLTPGLQTNRDAWVYSFSAYSAEENVRSILDCYNGEVSRLESEDLSSARTASERLQLTERLVDRDPKRISWSSSLLSQASQARRVDFALDAIVKGNYRPFTRQFVYFNADLNHRTGRLAALYPTASHTNLGFYLTGMGSDKPFSVHMTDGLPDLAYWGSSNGQYFARYWYRRIVPGEMLPSREVHGFEQVDNIADAALADYRLGYSDPSITKDDIFYYIYGILHSPEYRGQFESDLRKSLPRIPKVEDFSGFAEAGRLLARLHLDYEHVEPYAGIQEEIAGQANRGPADRYRVSKKMRFASKGDRTRILYSPGVTLTGVPEAAYRYRLGSRSAVEWIMDRYYVRTDKASGIVNDPNDWSDDPRYIVDLLKRVVTVSLETMKIVDALPPLDILPDQ